MRTITFFSEKGGVGKTTMTTLFSSWLAYNQKAKVTAIDFDFPSYHLAKIRQNDMSLIANPNFAQYAKMTEGNVFYPVIPCKGSSSYSASDLASINNWVRSMRNQNPEGYLVMDFPGRFLTDDPVRHLASAGLLDMVVYIADSDRQSRASVYMVNSVLREFGQKTLVLWNRETRSERIGRRDWYTDAEKSFAMMDITVMSTRIRDIPIVRRDGDTFGFVRSTLCWPEQNVQKSCPYIVDIFSEIKARLDGTWKPALAFAGKKEEQ